MGFVVEYKPLKENPMVGHRLTYNTTTVETVRRERGEVKNMLEIYGRTRSRYMEAGAELEAFFFILE